MSDKIVMTIFTFLIVGIIMLGIMNINLSSHVSNIEQNIQFLNANMNNVVNGMYPTNSDILTKIDSMNQQITENGKLYFNETTVIKGYNAATSSANVEVSFGLKQFNPGDEVYVSALNTSGKSYEFMASSSGIGRFTAMMTLPLQDNYTLSYSDLGTVSTSDSLPDLSLADNLSRRFKYSFGSGQSYSQNQNQTTVWITPQFLNDTQGYPDLKVNKISLSVESEGNTVGTWDLSSYLTDDGSTQILQNDSQVQIQSGSDPMPTELRPDLSLPALKNVIEFIMPVAGAEAKLSFTDNLGIHYEETDQIYAGSALSNVDGSPVYQAIPVNGVNSDSSIHIVK